MYYHTLPLNGIYCMVNLGDFVQALGKECVDDRYRYFEKVHEALDYCASDVRCVGIVDFHCDNENEFSVCLGGIRSSHRTPPDCVYKKCEKRGEHDNVLKSLVGIFTVADIFLLQFFYNA